MTDRPPHDGSAPISRRAAREAAGGQGDTPPVAAPRASTPGGGVPPQREASAPPASAATAPRAGTLDALFTGEVTTQDVGHVPSRHDRDRRKSRVAKWVVFVVILAIIGGVGAGATWVWLTYEDQIRSVMGWEEPKDFEAGMETGEATITIVSGDDGSSISEKLYEAGVTKTAGAFYDHLIATQNNPPFQPGVYALRQQMTSAAALEAILDPANKREDAAQIAEGLTVDQTLQILADSTGLTIEELQAAASDPSAYGVAAASLEGWLFPATYQFDPDLAPQQILQTLVDRTVQSLDSAGVPAERRQEILTTASIIQREARLTDDFYKVSRVIANRLADGMLLQMDSTAQYGFDEMHDGTASSSAEALADDNAWNTYVRTGLPAGPISNPGDVAIDAAMNPVDGPWFYFVTWNMETGETIFSTTMQEHEAGIEQWHQWCADNDNAGC